MGSESVGNGFRIGLDDERNELALKKKVGMGIRVFSGSVGNGFCSSFNPRGVQWFRSPYWHVFVSVRSIRPFEEVQIASLSRGAAARLFLM